MSSITAISSENNEPIVSDVGENIESCFYKTAAFLYTFAEVINQVFLNTLGDFLHNENLMYADQRFMRQREAMKYSEEPISQTPFFFERFLHIPPDATMNEYDLDRAFYDVYIGLHAKLKKAIHYVIWKQAGCPDIDPDLFGKDHIESTPRSEYVKIALRHICSYAELHREYLPHRFVLYTDDVEIDRIVLEGIYNITLSIIE